MTYPKVRAVEALHTERHAGRRCTMAELCPAWRDVTRDIAVLTAAGVIFDPAEVKVLTETATRVAYALGRKDAGEEIAEHIETFLDGPHPPEVGCETCSLTHQLARIARKITSQDPEAASDATSGVPESSEVGSESQGLSNRLLQEPCGHPTCPCASQEAR